MKSLTKLIIFVLSISYALTGAGDLDDTCLTTGSACTDTNAECKSNVCQCKSGYHLDESEGKCVENLALDEIVMQLIFVLIKLSIKTVNVNVKMDTLLKMVNVNQMKIQMKNHLESLFWKLVSFLYYHYYFKYFNDF